MLQPLGDVPDDDDERVQAMAGVCCYHPAALPDGGWIMARTVGWPVMDPMSCQSHPYFLVACSLHFPRRYLTPAVGATVPKVFKA